ncbi:MAG: prepilin peptidase [Alphaproteobacteria bacterium]|nr:prepilin peptidase [Alphaproteobacteria bacterium]
MPFLYGWFGWLLVVPLGLCLGSFASAIAARVPQGRSWIVSDKKFSRSACMICGHQLSVLDLVPLFSWIFLKGRCRYCHGAIGWHYPVIELTCLLMALLVYGGWGYSLTALFVFLAIPFCVALCVIDLKHMVLPDQLNFILAVLGIGYVLSSLPPAVSVGIALAGVAVGAALYALTIFSLGKLIGWLKHREALGLGDVKFMAVAGVWMGLSSLPYLLMAGGTLGVFLAMFWKKLTGEERFPFGPALIIGFLLVLLLQSPGAEALFKASP